MAKPKCKTWGFDLSSFPSEKAWKSFLKRNKCKKSGSKNLYGDYMQKAFGHKDSHYFWKCDGVDITTEHPGHETVKRSDLDGHLGYIGVEFKDRSKWNKIRDDFVESADHIKEETPCESGFINIPSIAKKMKPFK